MLYRLSEGAHKIATLYLGLSVPKDYSFSSLGLVCATKPDHNIQFKSFSSPCQRFFNSANVCYSLLKVLISIYGRSKARGNVAHTQELSGTGATPTTDCNETPAKSASAIARSVTNLLFL